MKMILLSLTLAWSPFALGSNSHSDGFVTEINERHEPLILETEDMDPNLPVSAIEYAELAVDASMESLTLTLLDNSGAEKISYQLPIVTIEFSESRVRTIIAEHDGRPYDGDRIKVVVSDARQATDWLHYGVSVILETESSAWIVPNLFTESLFLTADYSSPEVR